MTREIELQKFADHCVAWSWKKFNNIYGLSIGIKPAVKLNKRLKTTGGRAFLEHGYIDLCYTLINQLPHQYRDEIIPHELAHMVAWRLYKDPGHGPQWKGVMVQYGIEPKRCHNLFDELINKANLK
jgi:predicted SprT family Zn-dependent metalloprotease